MPDSKIVSIMSERRQLADKAASLGQEVLKLREFKAAAELREQQSAQQIAGLQEQAASLQNEISSLRQEVSSAQQDVSSLQQETVLLRQNIETLQQKATSLRRQTNAQQQELAMLKRSRLLRLGRRLRQMFRRPTWD